MSPVKALIEELRLVPHPEGGWYRETWRAPATEGERSAATAILFLLEAHQRSHWHRVDAAELWLWHAGDALLLSLSADERGPVGDIRLGPDVLSGDNPQYLVQPRRMASRGAPAGKARLHVGHQRGFAWVRIRGLYAGAGGLAAGNLRSLGPRAALGPLRTFTDGTPGTVRPSSPPQSQQETHDARR